MRPSNLWGSEGTTKAVTAKNPSELLDVCFVKSLQFPEAFIRAHSCFTSPPLCARVTVGWTPLYWFTQCHLLMRRFETDLSQVPLSQITSQVELRQVRWSLPQEKHVLRGSEAAWEWLLLRLPVVKGGVTAEAFRIYAWLSGSSRHLSLSQIKEHPILTQIHMSDQPSLWYLCHPRGDSGFGIAHYSFQGQLADCLWLLMTRSAVFFTPLLQQTRQPRGFYSINAYPGPASCLVWCLVSQSSCCFWKSSTRYLSFCSQSQ